MSNVIPRYSEGNKVEFNDKVSIWLNRAAGVFSKDARPVTPADFAVTTKDNALLLTWTPDTRADFYNVYASSTNDVNAKLLLERLYGDVSSFIHYLGGAATRYYWLEACTNTGRAGELVQSSGTSDAVSGAPTLDSDKKVVTAGDYTGAGTSFADVDATNLSITLNTGARRVFLSVTAMGKGSGNTQLCLDIDIDGNRQGQALGLVFADSLGGVHGQNVQLCFTHMTDVLSEGSHTFKLQPKTSVAVTFTLYASTSVSPVVFSAVELL